MKTRAKFRCEKVEEADSGTLVTLTVVTSGSPENEEFFRWTPFGELEMGVVNDAVKFEEGAEYYLDFTKAEQ